MCSLWSTPKSDCHPERSEGSDAKLSDSPGVAGTWCAGKHIPAAPGDVSLALDMTVRIGGHLLAATRAATTRDRCWRTQEVA